MENNNKRLLECLLFIRGSEGLDTKLLKELLNISTDEARKMLKTFLDQFNNENHGIKVMEFNDVFKFTTLPEYKEIISELVTIERKKKLSESAIETVGIIAYKQPITKTEISNIRGVNSDGVVQTLLEKELIEEVGVKQTPGNPVLFGITKKFYDYFQISSLKELPKLEEFNEETEKKDFDLFSSQRADNNLSVENKSDLKEIANEENILLDESNE